MSKEPDTRRRILDATRRLLESRGAGVAMGEIAREAGVTRQLLYFHFDGRTSLLLEASRAVDADVRTADQQALVDGAGDGRSALRAAVRLQGSIKPRIHGVAAAIDRARADDPAAAAAWDERETARHDRCMAVVRRLADEDLLRPPWTVEEAARVMWSVTSQHAWADLVGDAGWTTDEWVASTTRLLEAALVDHADSTTSFSRR